MLHLEGLSDRIIREIHLYAERHDVQKVVLFGSRARNTHTERSDIDIAVYGGDCDGFYWDVKENMHTLLMLDIVDMESGVSQELQKEIKKDGVVIYEKNR